MRGLDTPVLLAFLQGAPKARALVRALAGEEVATTEVNLFELELLARRDPSPGKGNRLQAVERLRRKLTVLAIDEEAAHRAAVLAASARHPGPEGSWLSVAAAETHGCSEWITTAAAVPPKSGTKLKVSLLERWTSKER